MKKVIYFLLFACVMSTQAQNVIRPKISGPGELWVNSYNGVLFFARCDAATKNSSLPLDVTFYYNSSSNNNEYGYGIGFSLGYEKRYSLDEEGNVTIESGDGRVDFFTRYGNDFEAPPGVFSTLTIGDGKYFLRSKEGDVYEFGDSYHKRVTAITDCNGNRTVLRYNDGLLSEICNEAVGHTAYLKYRDRLLVELTATFIDGSITYSYDSRKRLVKRTDAMGYVTLYEYDNKNRICRVIDAAGQKAVVEYNIEGKVSLLNKGDHYKLFRYESDRTLFIDYSNVVNVELAIVRKYPWNRYSYYRWDEYGRLIETAVAGSEGAQMIIEYDEDNNVTKVTDANGNSTSYTYDDRGNVLSMRDALGRSINMTYTKDYNKPQHYSDKSGATFVFDYDNKGNLLSIVDPLGTMRSFTYDSKGCLLTMVDGNGNVTSNKYNSDGSIAQTMDAAGNVSTISYDSFGNIVEFVDAQNNRTCMEYDKNGNIIKVTDALGSSIKFSYDKVGNVVRLTDPLGRISAYTYNANGKVLSYVQPDGSMYKNEYDNSGRLVSQTDPNNNTVLFEWNSMGLISAVENEEGEVVRLYYDNNGNMLSVYLPNGNVLRYYYDELNRLLGVFDNIGLIEDYIYDECDRIVRISDAERKSTKYSYDALGRLKTERNHSGEVISYEYDNNSNITSVTDENGNETMLKYNSLNQITAVRDALNRVTSYEYDANGNMVKVTDAKGNSTKYLYDAVGRNTVITFANGHSRRYMYDNIGNVVLYKDCAGNEFKFSYNSLGQLVERINPDGSRNNYTYDAIGNLLSAVNKNATVGFTYDKAGRMLSETLNGRTISFSYNVAEGRRKITYPSGMVVENIIDVRNNILSIMQDGIETVSFDYSAVGQLVSKRYLNGTDTRYEYNSTERIATIKDNRGIVDLAMDYDAADNVISCINRLDNNCSEFYGYDAANQLIKFRQGESLVKEYEFDLLGNLQKTLYNGDATHYESNNVNSYTAVRGLFSFVPEYDENGNLTWDGSHRYIYDYDNNLIGYDGNGEVYKYDALGRRIAKNNTVYSYYGTQMIEETTNGNTSSYLCGNYIDDVLQMKSNDNIHYFHTNHLGSTIAISDSEGNVVERVTYDAYGAPSFYDADGVSTDVSSFNNPILYTGREYNAEIGNYHYRARAMHPMLGRFMQKDPLMYINGMNDYSYVANNPMNLVDPSGLYVRCGPLFISFEDARGMAKAAYKDDYRDNVNGWTPARVFNNPSSGFRAVLFENDNKYVLAFSGTDDLVDWGSNILQSLGFPSPQYEETKAVSECVLRDFGPDYLGNVGHSLGGGEASAAAYNTGKPAIVFNPAGLSDRYKTDRDDVDIIAYISGMDLLNSVNKGMGNTYDRVMYNPYNYRRGIKKPHMPGLYSLIIAIYDHVKY